MTAHRASNPEGKMRLDSATTNPDHIVAKQTGSYLLIKDRNPPLTRPHVHSYPPVRLTSRPTSTSFLSRWAHPAIRNQSDAIPAFYPLTLNLNALSRTVNLILHQR
ncbi:hypothetical protein MTO96_040585 [Rhipicephalus appendiculatus]